jgi:hypothetical protein
MNPFTPPIDFQSFLARLDPVWNPLVHRGGRYYDQRPASTRCDWGEAALIGNGMMGAAIYKKTPNGIAFELGRNDVEAHQYLKGVDWCVPRIPIGDLRLEPEGEVLRETMRLDLYRAEATGEIQTKNGKVSWRAFTDAVRDVLVLEVNCEGGARCPAMLKPAHGVSPRLAWVEPEKAAAVSNVIPPKPVLSKQDGITLSVQELADDAGAIDGECAVALQGIELGPDHHAYFLSIRHSRKPASARDEVLGLVRNAVSVGLFKLEAEHRAWWADFHPRSFLSLSDTRWEAFYHIQMYKLASTTRGQNAEAIDNQGVWLTDSSWPGTWWNLNVQLSYSPLAKANRLDLARSLPNALKTNEDQIRLTAEPICADGMYLGRASGRTCGGNTMPKIEDIMGGNLHIFELGNFTWIAKLLYDQYRCTLDRRFLSETAFPILKASMNVAMALLTRWDDGKLHLPKTTSPEYPDPKNPARSNSCPSHDTSYDLALIQWGLQTLLASCVDLGVSDPLESKWKETLRDLTPLCVNENGIMVARDLPFEVSHRHYSHLFALYPLGLLDLEKPEELALAKKSMHHWIGKRGALQGYSYTGAAAMAALLGDGKLALECLNGLREFLLPNTMYVESGGPVIETPLSGAESLLSMFLLSERGTVRLFPAVPDAFRDVAFAGLLAEGAFEVSGLRSDGVNRWVHVKSLAGAPLRIAPNLSGTVHAHGERNLSLKSDGDGIFKIDLKLGEWALLYTGDAPPEMKMGPVPSEKEFENHYGSIKSGMGTQAHFAITRVRDNPRA